MRGIPFLRLTIPIYFALILILPCSETLRSLVHLWIRFDCERIQMKGMPLTYAARLQKAVDESRREALSLQISNIDGIDAVEHFLPIPEWKGNPESQEQWDAMWKAYVTPVLYATSAIQIKWHDQAEELAGAISQVSGVETVLWDSESHFSRMRQIEQTRAFQAYINTFFFLFFLAVAGGLVVSYPVRLRRQYIVRTGSFGVGTHVKSESIWLMLIASHAVLSILVYFLVFTLGYFFFPFPLQPEGDPSYAALLLEGIFVVGGLVSAVCLIGWWLESRELDIAAGLPITHWEGQ